MSQPRQPRLHLLLRPLALALALTVAGPATASAVDVGGATRPAIIPDHLTVQFAGEIGFLSAGFGYRFAQGKIRLDLLYGWVPASIGGDDLYALTGKVTLAPWQLSLGDRWRLEPIHAAVQGTRSFGSQYFTLQPSRYPRGYYDLPTAWYSGVAVGTGVARRDARGDELGLYVELVALPMALRDWWRNRSALDLPDVVSVAVGMQFAF